MSSSTCPLGGMSAPRGPEMPWGPRNWCPMFAPWSRFLTATLPGLSGPTTAGILAQGRGVAPIWRRQEKATVKLINLLIGPSFPIVSVSRFTCSLQALGRVLMGRAVRRIVPRAFATMGGFDSGTVTSTPSADIAEFGSVDLDMMEQKKSRQNTVAKWLCDPASDFALPICHVCCRIIQDFEFEFFPEARGGTLMKLEELVDRFSSPILKCLSNLHTALAEFNFRSGGPWRLLGCMGIGRPTGAMRAFARKQLLPLVAGISHKVDVKYSSFPCVLIRAISEQWSAQEASETLTALVDAKDCCLPVFARHFRQQFPTVLAMESPLGRQTLHLWAEAKGFQTLECERGHASERKMLAAASAPGEAWQPTQLGRTCSAGVVWCT